MATPFNDQWMLDRARVPGALEHVSPVTHFDEQGFAHAESDERCANRAGGVLAVLAKHPRWVDRDI